MNRSRPVNLNLFTIKFPLPSIVSILHRISGVVLLLMVPFVLWVLSYSLTEPGFTDLQNFLINNHVKIFLWLLLLPFCFHLIAGIRHLLSDIHLGDSLWAGRLSAVLTFVFFAVLIILTGVWLW